MYPICYIFNTLKALLRKNTLTATKRTSLIYCKGISFKNTISKKNIEVNNNENINNWCPYETARKLY